MLVYSFILIFFLLPHKRDLSLKACILTIFLLFSICNFSLKNSLSSFPENTLKSITTSEFFPKESIKSYGFANVVSFNWRLNLFYFSKLRYRNNMTYSWLLLLLSGDFRFNPWPLMVLSNITMASGLFLKREVFILCILTSTVFYQK